MKINLLMNTSSLEKPGTLAPLSEAPLVSFLWRVPEETMQQRVNNVKEWLKNEES
jgi:hypothetical protein